MADLLRNTFLKIIFLIILQIIIFLFMYAKRLAAHGPWAVSPQQKKNTVLVSGTIVDTAGDPIIGALTSN